MDNGRWFKKGIAKQRAVSPPGWLTRIA